MISYRKRKFFKYTCSEKYDRIPCEDCSNRRAISSKFTCRQDLVAICGGCGAKSDNYYSTRVSDATPGSSIELVDMMQQTPLIVLENGASTIKVGVVNESGTEPRCVVHPFTSPYRRDKLNRLIPNSVVRSKGDKMTYFGHEMEHCRDFSSLYYRLPFEKVCPTPMHQGAQDEIVSVM